MKCGDPLAAVIQTLSRHRRRTESDPRRTSGRWGRYPSSRGIGGASSSRLASEQFRSAPRTCRPLCGRLSMRESDRTDRQRLLFSRRPLRERRSPFAEGGGQWSLLKTTANWPNDARSSPLRALPPASHKRYSRLGWIIWRSLLGLVGRQKCSKIPPASEISWAAGSYPI